MTLLSAKRPWTVEAPREPLHRPRLGPPPERSGAVMPPAVTPSSPILFGAEGYGRTVARAFNLDLAPTVATTSLKRAQLSITRLSSAASRVGLSSPLPAEKAYGVVLQLQDAADNTIWRGGRPVSADPALAGSISISHLEDEPAMELRAPFDMLLIHIPEMIFGELADRHGAPRIQALADEAGQPDPVVHHLGRALLPWLEQGPQTASLFFDHVAFAIHSRLASRYGRLHGRPAAPIGGLTAWQERVAKAALAADLTTEPALSDVADACRLPLGRFIRAFRQTTGAPPHRWLRGVRVERAKELLLSSGLALAQIAYDCGFADQSHFNRVFTAAVGTTPGAWRRARRA
jgi:AraC family transcriptional regulator